MEFLAEIIGYFSGTLGMVELAATISSAICVWLATQENIWTWFWGAIGVVLFGYLFFQFQLYSDMGLQLFYFLPLQFLGYYWWKTKGPNADNDLPVTVLSNTKRWVVVGFVVATSLGLGYVMANYTDASFPYIDALTTMMSVAAQYYMMKKVWESWVLWVSMDVIAINVYWAKGLIVTSGLYGLFLVLAAYGCYTWYKRIGQGGPTPACAAGVSNSSRWVGGGGSRWVNGDDK